MGKEDLELEQENELKKDIADLRQLTAGVTVTLLMKQGISHNMRKNIQNGFDTAIKDIERHLRLPLNDDDRKSFSELKKDIAKLKARAESYLPPPPNYQEKLEGTKNTYDAAVELIQESKIELLKKWGLLGKLATIVKQISAVDVRGADVESKIQNIQDSIRNVVAEFSTLSQTEKAGFHRRSPGFYACKNALAADKETPKLKSRGFEPNKAIKELLSTQSLVSSASAEMEQESTSRLKIR